MQLDIKTLSAYRLDRAKEDSEKQIHNATEFISRVETFLKEKLENGAL